MRAMLSLTDLLQIYCKTVAELGWTRKDRNLHNTLNYNEYVGAHMDANTPRCVYSHGENTGSIPVGVTIVKRRMAEYPHFGRCVQIASHISSHRISKLLWHLLVRLERLGAIPIVELTDRGNRTLSRLSAFSHPLANASTTSRVLRWIARCSTQEQMLVRVSGPTFLTVSRLVESRY
jgi:hypothetical protein